MSRKNRSKEIKRDVADRFVWVIENGLGMKLNAAAKKLGYKTPSTLYSIKKGRCNPDIEKVVELSKLADTQGHVPSLDWVLTGYGQAMRPTKLTTNNKYVDDIINILSTKTKEEVNAVYTLLQIK